MKLESLFDNFELLTDAPNAVFKLREIILQLAVKGKLVRQDPKINQTELNKILVAIPPLAEQKRIVAKVDRLMSLCDELEEKLKEKRSHSEKLMEVAAREVLAV